MDRIRRNKGKLVSVWLVGSTDEHPDGSREELSSGSSSKWKYDYLARVEYRNDSLRVKRVRLFIGKELVTETILMPNSQSVHDTQVRL